MIDDAKAVALLATLRTVERLPDGIAMTATLLDSLPLASALGEPSDTSLVAPPDESAGQGRPVPENAAYVIYTSGSTGRP